LAKTVNLCYFTQQLKRVKNKVPCINLPFFYLLTQDFEFYKLQKWGMCGFT